MKDLFDASTARALKERGLNIIESYPNDSWIKKARSVAEMLAAKNGDVTIDDVLKICPRPDGISPNANGAVFRGKKWEMVSFKQSERISRHAGGIRVWRLRDKL